MENSSMVQRNSLWSTEDTHYYVHKELSWGVIVAIVVGVFFFIVGVLYLYFRRFIYVIPPEVGGPEPPAVELAAAQGLNRRAIDLFPVLAFSVNETIGFGESDCQICMERFQHGEPIRVLPTCMHIFHDWCVSPWLSFRSTQCPVCRHDYSSWVHVVPDVP